MKAPRNLTTSPKGGFTFKEPSTGRVFFHKHPRALLKQVLNYRAELGLDVDGGWEERFWDEYCRQHEEMACDDTEGGTWFPNMVTIWNFLQSMWKWLRTGGNFVSQEEAERRANVCLSGANGEPCPLNRPSGICWGCKNLSTEIRNLLNGRKTKYDSQLQVCIGCGCNLDTKIWFPNESLVVDEAKLPSFCWQRRG